MRHLSPDLIKLISIFAGCCGASLAMVALPVLATVFHRSTHFSTAGGIAYFLFIVVILHSCARATWLFLMRRR